MDWENTENKKFDYQGIVPFSFVCNFFLEYLPTASPLTKWIPSPHWSVTIAMMIHSQKPFSSGQENKISNFGRDLGFQLGKSMTCLRDY